MARAGGRKRQSIPQGAAGPGRTGVRPGLPLLAVLLTVLAAGRVAATWTTFSATADEPMHFAAGLRALSNGRYDVQIQNPPMPRVLAALPAWLAGARYGDERPSRDLRTVFHLLPDYQAMLAGARAGTLLFLAIAAAALWFWARREAGPAAAALAVLLFTTEPLVLAHSGLATLDVAGTAGLALCLLAFARWLDLSDLRRTVVLGAAAGFAVNCKLLSIPYVPLACAGYLVPRLVWEPELRRRWREAWRLLLVPLVAFLVIWAGYGFTVGPLRGFGLVPAPTFLAGVLEVLDVNRAGWRCYAFGTVSYQGWWWYFPVSIALKTTIPTLLLLAAAVALCAFDRRLRPTLLRVLLPAFAILAFSTRSTLDVGVRYVLPIYVPFALAGAIVLREAFVSRRLAARGAGMLLVIWQVTAGIAAHPDYLPYFNETARRDSGRFLVDSNLDWGQDVLRLRDRLRERRVAFVRTALFATADLDRLHFPRHRRADPFRPVRGWLAISEQTCRLDRAEFGGWAWLDPYPYERVGSSIRLYWIPR